MDGIKKIPDAVNLFPAGKDHSVIINIVFFLIRRIREPSARLFGTVITDVGPLILRG